MPTETRVKYLHHVAKFGTMRAASEVLNVAASSISRQIAALEKELGIALVEKDGRKIKLTEAGAATCQYHRERSSLEEAFLSQIDDFKRLRTGKVVIATGQALVTQHFNDVVQTYLRHNSGMQVHVVTTTSTHMMEMVRNDEAHMGVRLGLAGDPKIQVRLDLPQPLKIVVHRAHPIANRQCIDLAELAGESIAMPTEDYSIHQLIHLADHKERVHLEPTLMTDSFALIVDFVKSGQGISILPEVVVKHELEQKKLVAIPTSNKFLNSIHCGLITRRGRQLPLGAYNFLTHVEAHLRQILC